MKGSGRHLGRTQDENVDSALTTAGKIFILAVVTMLIVVASLVVSLFGVFAALKQSEENELHTDCLLALVTHEPPKACAATLRQLEAKGFVGPIGPDGDRNPHNDLVAIHDRSNEFHKSHDSRLNDFHKRHERSNDTTTVKRNNNRGD